MAMFMVKRGLHSFLPVNFKYRKDKKKKEEKGGCVLVELCPFF
jgi:hypothetical protein